MSARLRLPARLSDPPADDRALLGRFADGRDGEAFAALVRRHGRMVLGVCRRSLGDAHLAEDAFQATFLVLARNPAAAARSASVGGWLFGVARRVGLAA
ncbi:MAG: sigma-70 family RNA polymerase sigma factor, partial [Gemmataceae bacterium]|nr:sigma-70 family RNA polymerase sigma factor [Gemmataceae bacterium]